MMGGDGTPVGDSCSAVFVTPRIAPVRISLRMADQNSHITVIYIFVHENRVASVSGSQIYQVFIVFTVVVDDLSTVPELVEKLIPQNAPDLLLCVLPVKPVGTDKENVLFFHPCIIQLLQNKFDGNFSVGSRLLAPFYPVREYNCHFGTFLCQFG
ncbi:hypothetical protein IMSAGC009_01227 [Lachnospiraceae bacterium]|nr:hypothetical protein IMSAGC009_01227 [Lachnospiraceae bacterium]